MNQAFEPTSAHPFSSTYRIVQGMMLGFAFLLPFLTWMQAAGCAVIMLLFNIFILPQLNGELREPTFASWVTRARTVVLIYPIAVLVLILLFRHDVYIAGAVWAIMALGDGTAGVIGEALRGPTLSWNRERTWTGFLAFVLAGTFGAYVLTRWIAPEIESVSALLMCLTTALLGATVQSLPIRLNTSISVPLLCGVFIYGLHFVEPQTIWSNAPYLSKRFAIAVGVNLIFALIAWAMKWVDRSGAAMGFLLGVAIYLGYGYRSFLILLAFILAGSMATRVGYANKAARGIAEHRGGARSWREALANCLAPAFFALLSISAFPQAAFLLAVVAALAEAAGDTISSELGQVLTDRVYLITTFQPVPTGENGGVSIAGTAAGIMASALIVGLGFGLGLCGPRPWIGAGLALAAAVAGNILDSLLGATVERDELVTNWIVNFSGTSFAGAIALALALRMR